jgi:hypothetical protein|nr:MAG TPA: hypothetical protein [Caudoviricetes sp.]
MIFNDTVSIFDSVETDDGMKILQYILSKVYLEKSFGSSIVVDGERKNYNATLFITDSFESEDEYVKPKSWASLPFDKKLTHFTIRQNQVVAPINTPVSYVSLDEILNNVDDSFRVIGVDYLDKVLPHFEVLCK